FDVRKQKTGAASLLYHSNPGPKRTSRSALGELEAGAGAALTVLLALLHARIAREEAGLLEALAQLAVVDLQRARDAVADRSGLAARAAAVHRDDDVELVDRLRQRQGLLDDHLQHFIAEVVVERAP